MWRVFRGRINVVFSPSFTSIPPQIHHQKPPSATTFSQKPLQKHHFTTPEKIPTKQRQSRSSAAVLSEQIS
jgi:hypothetical protein